VLRDGRIAGAALLVGGATAISIAHTLRFASEVAVEDVVFGPGRSPAISFLLSTLGTEMTAIVVYLLQSAWAGLLAVTALSPLLIWLLGATAIHAAARLSGHAARFGPMLVLCGYAAGLTRPLADLTGLALGSAGVGGQVAQVFGLVALVWLALLARGGIAAHYRVSGERATSILVVAIAFFYLAPLTLVLLAVAAILIAAIILEYVPARSVV